MTFPFMKSPQFKLDDLLRVEDLASKLKVSLKTVRSWVYLRKIPFTKIGRRVYFAAGVVEEMLRRNAVPAIPSQQRSSAGSVVLPVPTNAEKGGADTWRNMSHG
jgi:excisionase family DNA binding protein